MQATELGRMRNVRFRRTPPKLDCDFQAACSRSNSVTREVFTVSKKLPLVVRSAKRAQVAGKSWHEVAQLPRVKLSLVAFV